MFHLIGYLIGLLGFSAALALLLGRLRVPGAGLAAGALAGFLLGPSLLGRVAPDWFEGIIIGGREERVALEELEGQAAARELARQEARLPPTTLEAEVDELSAAAIATAETAWRDAQWRDQQPIRIVTLAAAGLFLLVAGLTRSTAQGPRPHVFQVVSVGVWSALLPGVLFLVILRWLDVEIAAACAAVAAIAGGATNFAPSDLAAADEAEIGGARLILAASRVALISAVATLLIAAFVEAPASALLAGAPCAAMLAGWAAPRVPARTLMIVRDVALVPIMTALLAVRIEFFEHSSLWMIVAALILSGDGRWFGAFLGAMLSGARRSLRTMRLVLGVMSAGTAQVALTAIALSAGVLPEEPAYALLAGAILMELTTNTRRNMARRIEETEEEIEEIRKSESTDDRFMNTGEREHAPHAAAA